MIQFVSNDQPLSSERPPSGVAGQQPGAGANAISNRQFVVEEGLVVATHDRLVHAFTMLTPEECAEMVGYQAYIEQARGMLMLIYGVDACRAFEVLKNRSQLTNVDLPSLARQMVEEFVALTHTQDRPTRASYDQVLLTAHRRVARQTV